MQKQIQRQKNVERLKPLISLPGLRGNKSVKGKKVKYLAR
jgi:hypothetical protein